MYDIILVVDDIDVWRNKVKCIEKIWKNNYWWI